MAVSLKPLGRRHHRVGANHVLGRRGRGETKLRQAGQHLVVPFQCAEVGVAVENDQLIREK